MAGHSDMETYGTITNGNTSIEADILIIGGGMGGMYGLYRFRQLGLKVKLMEAAPDFGGTWYWNRYPGARVDSEAPFYSLSIPEVYLTWNWSERFPDHREIRRYFKYVDDILGLSKDAYFNTIVTETRWDGSHWVLRTKDGKTAKCKYLVSATGSSYKKYYPDYKDINKFQGTIVHSAEYPDEGFDMRGKKVGVIGSGATGIQIVQELAKDDCQLTAFVRTPSITFPMAQRKLSIEEQETQKNWYDYLFKAAKTAPVGFPYNHTRSASIWDVSKEEREARFEYLWGRGGFAFQLSNYPDFIVDEKANAVYYDFWVRKVRERIKNQEKADIVAPREQQVLFGTKRATLEQDYFEMVDRTNVSLVNLRDNPIQRFTEKGIETTRGLLEFDILIFATGFHAVTGSLLDMGLYNKSSTPLSEVWKDGIKSHLGLAVPGFPNFFMTYSPQAPTALSNGPPIIEYQVDWIAQVIQRMQQQGISVIDAKKDAAEAWSSDLQRATDATLMPRTDSWWMGANIPGKKREPQIYISGLDNYIKICDAALENLDGFDLVKLA
ncbi:hypothetical protein NM208_g6579 [Fusarium decemcellulare]|uniref:Uncharacterized protein n=1 Tax=Fusarium decemcellulare TaxID=57161 RepID=A0ACC1SCH2_9HYPO|nr:hypothetical protein NM208_g6579 [Fusarium decemcellulare]